MASRTAVVTGGAHGSGYALAVAEFSGCGPQTTPLSPAMRPRGPRTIWRRRRGAAEGSEITGGRVM